jgi:hypothetical protein
MPKPHYEWNRAEPRALARCVQPEALPAEFAWPPAVNRFDLLTSEGPAAVAAVLYGLMRRAAIQYDLAPFHPREGIVQLVRTPATILAENRATCLDLAVLFATLCLANDLLPLIVVVDGHAFAGLSLTRTRRDNKRSPRPFAWDRGLMDEPSALQALAGQEYLLVECTGAAQSQSLSADFPEGRGRGSSGAMSFERAGAAGTEQVAQHLSSAGGAGAHNQRSFLYALDIHELQVGQGFDPASEDETATSAPPQRLSSSGAGDYGPSSVGGDYVRGDKTVTENIGGDKVGRDKFVTEHHGDNIKVGDIKGSTGIAIGRGATATVTTGLGADELAQLFAPIYLQIAARPPNPNVDNEEIRDKVQQIEKEVKKRDDASEPKLNRWLADLGGMAPDILDVTLSALAGPQAAAITVVKKVTEKARQLLGRDNTVGGGTPDEP